MTTDEQQDSTIRHPDGQHYRVRGHDLWVERAGEGEPLLLLAGLGPAGSHVIFHPFFDRLHSTHQVFYLDLHGRGRSEHPESLSSITFANDVADVSAVIDELDVDAVHVYGFSYGGLLGQALALDHADKIKTLIIANSLHSAEMWQQNHANINREIAAQLPETWDRIMAMRARGMLATHPGPASELSSAAPMVRFYNPDNAALLPDEPGARNLSLYPEFVGADVDFIIGGQVAQLPDFRPRLHALTVPTTVIAGRYDRALYPALQRQFVEFAPDIRLEMMERSGSFSHIEQPDDVCAVVRDVAVP